MKFHQLPFRRHCEWGHLLCSCDFLISMSYFLGKNHFGKKKILYLRDQYPLNFSTLDYEQSLFSLGDSLVSREKRTSELTSAKSPSAFKCVAHVYNGGAAVETIEFFCRRHYRVIGYPRKFDVHNKYKPENAVQRLM